MPTGFQASTRSAIEQQFGVVPNEAAVRQHIERQFATPKNRVHDYVEVVQEVIGPINRERIGVMQTNRDGS